MKRALLAVAAACALMASPAAATTIIQTQTAAAAASGVTTGLDFSKFDSSLGTLNSVTIQFDYFIPSVSGVAANNDRSNGKHTYTATLSGTAGLSGAGVNLSGPVSDAETTAKLNKGGSQTLSFGAAPTATGSKSTTITTLAGLANFVGSGDYLLDFTRNLTLDFQNAQQGVFTWNSSPLLGGSVKLTYDYSAAAPVITPPTGPVGGVPEPATWAMLIFGFGVTGGVLRRRRGQVAMVAAA